MRSHPLDKAQMRQDILGIPQQFALGYELARAIKSRRVNPQSVIIYGMGGSALPGELLQLFAKSLSLKKPIYINRDYELPPYADKKDMHIFISYSGNTEETLSAYKEARRQAFPHMIIIASGGTLMADAQKNGITTVLVPGGIQPRMALGYQFAALLGVLERMGIIATQQDMITRLAKTLNSKILEKEGKKLAKKFNDKILTFYAPDEYRALAYILKIQMNENGKTHAFLNTIPEMQHNELMAARDNKPIQPVILNPLTHGTWKRRVAIIKSLLPQAHTIDINNKNIYNGVFATLTLGNWISYYTALNNNIDPSPVHLVEALKKELA